MGIRRQAGKKRGKDDGHPQQHVPEPRILQQVELLRLQDELAGTENRIAVSRSDYNAAVKDYNTYIRGFPQAVTAKVTGAKSRPYYEAAPGTNVAPTVDFSKPGVPK